MNTLDTILILLGILFLHWIGDGVLQTDKMAKGKSSNWEDLLDHTVMYSFVFFIGSMIYFAFTMTYAIAFFSIITFFFHTATDYVTSRINSKLWKDGKVHNFFVSVLFDQFLHFVQLFLTFYFLTQ